MMTPERKTEKLAQLLKMLDESLTREEFVASFENVVKLVIESERKLSERIDRKTSEAKEALGEIQDTHKEIMKRIEEENSSSFSNMKRWAMEQVTNLFTKNRIAERMEAIDKKLGQVDERLEEMKDIKAPVPGVDFRLPEDGKDGSPDTPEKVRDKLENLEGEERLDVSAIKGLQEEIKKLKSIVSEARPIFGPGKTKIIVLDLSDQLDGSTKTFPIGTHFGIVGVWSSSSPFAWRPTIDYTEVGKTIVFDAAIDASVSLAPGQTLIVQYLK